MLWSMFSIAASIFGVLLFYIKHNRWPGYWEKRGVVCEKSRGPPGAAMFRRKSNQEVIWDICNKHHEERYVGFYQGNEPILLVKDPELIELITKKLLWESFFVLTEINWAFAPSKLEALFDSISERAEAFVAYFVKRTTNNIAMEMKDAFSRFSNDVLASCTLGITCSSLESKNNELFTMAKRATDSIRTKILNNGGNAHAFLKRTFENALRNRKPNTILTFFWKIPRSNPDAFSGHVLEFYLGAFEMISTLCSFMAYELAINPDVQSKLLQEIDWALKGETLTYDVVGKMKFLDMVVLEVLRKWPVKNRLEAVCCKPCALPNGNPTLVVEDGIKIVIPTLAVQNDPKYFPNPDLFDPERFSDENRGKIRPFTYFPFGLENDSPFVVLAVKVLFCHLLTQFSVQEIEKTQVPLKLDMTSCTTLAAENGIWLSIKRRKPF